MGVNFQIVSRRFGQWIRYDWLNNCTCSSTQCWCKKKDKTDQCIGRSKGGLSTKIHATCDALGNPTGFHLTAGQAHDLEGADALIDEVEADTFLADKAYDVDKRVLDRLAAMKCEAVIPSKCNRKKQREYDKELYKARHLIENFFAKLKQYRAIATRYDKTSTAFLVDNNW
jgi:transposase